MNNQLIFDSDPRMKMQSYPILFIGNFTDSLFENMKKVMLENNGIGLAAIQIGIPFRMFIIGLSEKDIECFINPEIIKYSEETIFMKEGCLSVSNKHVEINRFKEIDVKYQDLKGDFHEETLTGIMSIVFQHEFDHLNGKLITDYE